MITHSTPLSCNSKELLHASLPTMSCCTFPFSLLPLSFPCLSKPLHSLTDPALPTHLSWKQGNLSLRPRSKWNKSWTKIQTWAHTWRVWRDRGTQPRLLHLALSRWVQEQRLVVYLRISSSLPCTSRIVALDGSELKHKLVTHTILHLFQKGRAAACLSGTFLLTCRTTFSMVRCFWISVTALFGPNPAILSQ